MTFLDELKRARISPISVYHQFLLKNHSSPDGVHVFFEGDADFSFYTGFLHRFIPSSKRLFPYRCGSKANVYDTHSKVMSAPPKGIVLFFVDKDFSDILNENYPAADNIYVTDYYSVENYVVTEDMLVRTWYDTFHFSNAVIEIDNILKKFRMELERFYKFTLPISAWMISLRRKGFHPILGNVNLAKLFVFDSDLTLEDRRELVPLDELNALERMCGVTTPVECRKEIDLIVQELASLEPKKYIRGKFELWFFVKFIDRLIDVLQSTVAVSGGKMSVKTQITEGNALVFLGPRLHSLPSLEEFLQKNLGTQREI